MKREIQSAIRVGDKARLDSALAEYKSHDSYVNELFMKACKFNDSMTVDSLIKFGVDINQPESIRTPLQWAVTLNHYEIVKLLLDSGADASLGNPPPLHIAVGMSRANIVRLLLNYHADLKKLDVSLLFIV